MDVAIRIGGIEAEGGAAMRKLADNRRILVVAPSHLDKRGRPNDLGDLTTHDLLRYGDAVESWRLIDPNGCERTVPAPARLRADNGNAVHDWCVEGLGIMLKSRVDVTTDLCGGRLEQILLGWHAGDTPIVALFPDRASMPRKTRIFLDAMVAAVSPERQQLGSPSKS